MIWKTVSFFRCSTNDIQRIFEPLRIGVLGPMHHKKGMAEIYCTGKKRAVKKKSADVGLAVEQFWALDKEFYETYPREYFLCKLDDALIRIAQPDQ